MPHLRIASVNVNGIRAAVRNGIHAWLDAADVDVLTVQEVRGEDEHLAAAFPDWSIVHDKATAKGRSGVAIVSRDPALAVRTAFGDDDFDSAGRWIEADFTLGDTPLTVVSAYVHTGEADTPKQDEKWRFLDAMTTRMSELGGEGRLALVTGDLNVGHRELDIKNWRGNRKKSGFLPRERAYFDRFLGAGGEQITGVDGTVGPGLGWVDIGRAHHGEVEGPYTWWSMRGKAFDNDSGWRIDYHLATPALAERATGYTIARAATYAERWSDHAPVIVDYTYE
ncbi:endonuclease/exonuclease/phosphatase family protein [Microbacterium esteraromaticum]|uniref:Endonuclease/exonuclease/phosphatase family protein n=1 Tax=Microbacterium esteraromaticum TaxID=57043 RepID=A0A939DXX9_9MICO|nr:exodeoxyribonuclease III [Microbacterium esteraromaticum]MBN8206940.1 endonuclease/exonuclease/phosphatase family protein [Microbacterium esteraromaticum]MBN8417095.1 endonuclease/exonuclease/phosphatase family protein [Microbacterium esteraromaticum]MBN8425724.1 endonuclease/exonuclease/phosphatase family protein [Microbacterium esteraromaticum]WDH77997.1 exodeoxyribonuclease III [Microbacterium esteraromaticum]